MISRVALSIREANICKKALVISELKLYIGGPILLLLVNVEST